MTCVNGTCQNPTNPTGCTDERASAVRAACASTGACQNGCSDASSCGTGQTCSGGHCVNDPAGGTPCTANSDCGASKTCINGFCHADCTTTGRLPGARRVRRRRLRRRHRPHAAVPHQRGLRRRRRVRQRDLPRALLQLGRLLDVRRGRHDLHHGLLPVTAALDSRNHWFQDGGGAGHLRRFSLSRSRRNRSEVAAYP